MAQTMTIEEDLKRIVLKVIRKPQIEFSRKASFKDMKADSLDVVQIIVAVEDAYGITISDEELKLCANIADFIGLIERELAAKCAGA